MNKSSGAASRHCRAILLSIKAEHANRILEGSKRWELRKVLPTSDFTRVYLCETGGTGVVGCFDVDELVRNVPLEALWEKVGVDATTRERFDTYFAPVNSGCAIKVRNPLKFPAAIPVKQLRTDFVSFVPPQSFLVLESGQPLYTGLDSYRAAAVRQSPPSVRLEPIEPAQYDSYRALVIRHISPHYLDIDSRFVDATLAIHQKGFDPAGFFTTRKEVLCIYAEGEKRIGFTTLTYKSGGCLKTGPTVLDRKFRSKGYGYSTRIAIEQIAIENKCRKIYCTCPDTEEATIRYLLRAGMRIEAHLEKHYATTHNELVFGKLLVADEADVRPIREMSNASCQVVLPSSLDKKQLIEDFAGMFAVTWARVSKTVAGAIVRQCFRNDEVDHDKKPKRMVCIADKGRCAGIITLLPKRGGAVKGVLVRATNDEASIRSLLMAAIEMATELRGRKIYFLHPILDPDVLRCLRSLGFLVEGVIRAPYRPGQDVVVISKFL